MSNGIILHYEYSEQLGSIFIDVEPGFVGLQGSTVALLFGDKS